MKSLAVVSMFLVGCHSRQSAERTQSSKKINNAVPSQRANFEIKQYSLKSKPSINNKRTRKTKTTKKDFRSTYYYNDDGGGEGNSYYYETGSQEEDDYYYGYGDDDQYDDDGYYSYYDDEYDDDEYDDDKYDDTYDDTVIVYDDPNGLPPNSKIIDADDYYGYGSDTDEQYYYYYDTIPEGEEEELDGESVPSPEGDDGYDGYYDDKAYDDAGTDVIAAPDSETLSDESTGLVDSNTQSESDQALKEKAEEEEKETEEEEKAEEEMDAFLDQEEEKLEKNAEKVADEFNHDVTDTCPRSCGGIIEEALSCDEWVSFGFTCSELERDRQCDCAGCRCDDPLVSKDVYIDHLRGDTKQAGDANSGGGGGGENKSPSSNEVNPSLLGRFSVLSWTLAALIIVVGLGYIKITFCKTEEENEKQSLRMKSMPLKTFEEDDELDDDDLGDNFYPRK